eukprot:763401-Hanusia_phi.AAC.2
MRLPSPPLPLVPAPVRPQELSPSFPAPEHELSVVLGSVLPPAGARTVEACLLLLFRASDFAIIEGPVREGEGSPRPRVRLHQQDGAEPALDAACFPLVRQQPRSMLLVVEPVSIILEDRSVLIFPLLHPLALSPAVDEVSLINTPIGPGKLTPAVPAPLQVFTFELHPVRKALHARPVSLSILPLSFIHISVLSPVTPSPVELPVLPASRVLAAIDELHSSLPRVPELPPPIRVPLP